MEIFNQDPFHLPSFKRKSVILLLPYGNFSFLNMKSRCKDPKDTRSKRIRMGHTHLLQDVQIVVSHNYVAHVGIDFHFFYFMKKKLNLETNTFFSLMVKRYVHQIDELTHFETMSNSISKHMA